MTESQKTHGFVPGDRVWRVKPAWETGREYVVRSTAPGLIELEGVGSVDPGDYARVNVREMTIPASSIYPPILRVRILHPAAKLPAYATAGSSGLDLVAAIDDPREVWTAPVAIPCGIAIELPEGYEGQVRPRSGLAFNHGISCHFGTLDHDYRGQVHALLYPFRHTPYVVRPGDRIAQLVIAPVARVRVVQVEQLSDTERGEAGFGSTGR